MPFSYSVKHMKFASWILLSLVLCACASTKPKPQAASAKSSSTNSSHSESPTASAQNSKPQQNAKESQETPENSLEPTSPDEPEEAFRSIEASDLRDSISSWIARHPEAEFEEAARMANRFLRLHGYPLVLDARRKVKKGQTEVKIVSGKKVFHFTSGKELSSSPDICGERFLRIPALLVNQNTAALIHKGKEYRFSLKGFQREKFRIFRGKRLISTIFAPEPSEPIGISANGKSIYLKFPLNEAETIGWWQKVAVFQPSLLDEEPYLTLRVQNHRLYFDENIEHLAAQEFEVEEGDESSFRWKFLPSKLVLELSSRCDSELKKDR